MNCGFNHDLERAMTNWKKCRKCLKYFYQQINKSGEIMTKEIGCPDNMECPCPCEKCGKWFELQDGDRSEKWFPNTVICSSCGRVEREEIEHDEEIDGFKEMIDEAESNIKYAQSELAKLDIHDYGKTVVFNEEQKERLFKAISNRTGKGRTFPEIVIDLCEKGDVY
jgi:hypothetical protein